MPSHLCWPAHLSITRVTPPHVTRTNHSGNNCFMTHSVTRIPVTMPAPIQCYWSMPKSSSKQSTASHSQNIAQRNLGSCLPTGRGCLKMREKYTFSCKKNKALERDRAVIAAGASLNLLRFCQLRIWHSTHPRQEQQVLRFTYPGDS